MLVLKGNGKVTKLMATSKLQEQCADVGRVTEQSGRKASHLTGLHRRRKNGTHSERGLEVKGGKNQGFDIRQLGREIGQEWGRERPGPPPNPEKDIKYVSVRRAGS